MLFKNDHCLNFIISLYWFYLEGWLEQNGKNIIPCYNQHIILNRLSMEVIVNKSAVSHQLYHTHKLRSHFKYVFKTFLFVDTLIFIVNYKIGNHLISEIFANWQQWKLVYIAPTQDKPFDLCSNSAYPLAPPSGQTFSCFCLCDGEGITFVCCYKYFQLKQIPGDNIVWK